MKTLDTLIAHRYRMSEEELIALLRGLYLLQGSLTISYPGRVDEEVADLDTALDHVIDKLGDALLAKGVHFNHVTDLWREES